MFDVEVLVPDHRSGHQIKGEAIGWRDTATADSILW
jgi:hypothetical protein